MIYPTPQQIAEKLRPAFLAVRRWFRRSLPWHIEGWSETYAGVIFLRRSGRGFSEAAMRLTETLADLSVDTSQTPNQEYRLYGVHLSGHIDPPSTYGWGEKLNWGDVNLE